MHEDWYAMKQRNQSNIWSSSSVNILQFLLETLSNEIIHMIKKTFTNDLMDENQYKSLVLTLPIWSETRLKVMEEYPQILKHTCCNQKKLHQFTIQE